MNDNDLFRMGFEEYPTDTKKIKIFIKDNKYIVTKRKHKYQFRLGEGANIKVKNKKQLVNLIK